MRLFKARVQNYRSIIDTGEFDIEELKTIFVGPNESGKTVILKALQQLSKPSDTAGFDVLRDYPRSKYNEIKRGLVSPKDITIVTGYFKMEADDKKLIDSAYHDCVYKLSRNIDNSGHEELQNSPPIVNYKELRNNLTRLVAHMDSHFEKSPDNDKSKKPSLELGNIVRLWTDNLEVAKEKGALLKEWLNKSIIYIEEGNSVEENRHSSLVKSINDNDLHYQTLEIIGKLKPVFVLFNNYFKVKPSIHLEHLAQRTDSRILDDEFFDYGNLCLLKLLGFSARELADIGKTASPDITDKNALQAYKDRLDSRSYQLNSASVQLTNEIRSVWMPNPIRPEADKLKVTADGQYLKVVVEDDIGVDIELDQRSEGFQWLVSFFVVFFAEAMDKHKNAILLLDEPGMSLHGLKQRDFRDTISRLAIKNQTIYSTHSPFLVGPDELDIVRVVELKNRTDGTKVHTTLSSSDPAGLLPLQEALGYGLAQSLFSQHRNLVLEGLTDYWYLDATSQLFKDAGLESVSDKIALVFANSAGKVVYYATILFANHLKVAALLDSDAAGDQAAQQDNLVHTLGNKNILRTKDYLKGVSAPEIEDLLRETLISIVKKEYGIDTSSIALSQTSRPIIDIFNTEVSGFSKYKLAKAYIRWTKSHAAKDLVPSEIKCFGHLIQNINKVLE